MTNMYQAAEEAFGSIDHEKVKQGQIAKFNKTKRMVYNVIQENPDAANNDSLLLSLIWEKQGFNYDRSLFDNLSRVYSPETITRSRRWLHEHNFITYSKDSMKRRTDKFKKDREEYTPKRYEPVYIDGERVMKVVNDLVDSVKPYEQTRLV